MQTNCALNGQKRMERGGRDEGHEGRLTRVADAKVLHHTTAPIRKHRVSTSQNLRQRGGGGCGVVEGSSGGGWGFRGGDGGQQVRPDARCTRLHTAFTRGHQRRLCVLTAPAQTDPIRSNYEAIEVSHRLFSRMTVHKLHKSAPFSRRNFHIDNFTKSGKYSTHLKINNLH